MTQLLASEARLVDGRRAAALMSSTPAPSAPVHTNAARPHPVSGGARTSRCAGDHQRPASRDAPEGSVTAAFEIENGRFGHCMVRNPEKLREQPH